MFWMEQSTEGMLDDMVMLEFCGFKHAESLLATMLGASTFCAEMQQRPCAHDYLILQSKGEQSRHYSLLRSFRCFVDDGDDEGRRLSAFKHGFRRRHKLSLGSGNN